MLSVDTGMGLERINSVLNYVTDNYNIPFFQTLQNLMQNLSNTKIDKSNKASFEIICDHARAIFLVSDGVYPSNEGKGYVLRRIIKRAVLHENKIYSSNNNILENISNEIIKMMQNTYPELKNSNQEINNIIFEEIYIIINHRERERNKVYYYIIEKSYLGHHKCAVNHERNDGSLNASQELMGEGIGGPGGMTLVQRHWKISAKRFVKWC